MKKLVWDKAKIKKNVIDLLLIIVGATMTAVAMHVFILPAKFAPGGVSGIAAIIQTVSGFLASYSLIILNFPLIILAFIFLSKQFAIKTTLSILISAGWLQLFEMFNLYKFQESGGHILGAIAGGIIMGAGIGLLVRVGASTGGSDIVSLLIQKKKSSLSISWILFYINLFVIALAGILYIGVAKMDVNETFGIMLYSLVMVFVNSKSMEVVLNGVNSAVKFEVITSKPNELGQAIIKQLSRGVTIVNSRGAYTDTENSILICVVTKRQITPFRKLIKDVDPQAFAYGVDTREVLGNGFKTQK